MHLVSVAVHAAGMLLEQLSSGLVSKSKRLQKAWPFCGSISTQQSSVGGRASACAAPPCPLEAPMAAPVEPVEDGEDEWG